MKRVYIATIQVLIPEHSSAASCDFVSETLRNSPFLDSSYLEVGGQLLLPVEKFVPEEYEEGDAFA